MSGMLCRSTHILSAFRKCRSSIVAKLASASGTAAPTVEKHPVTACPPILWTRLSTLCTPAPFGVHPYGRCVIYCNKIPGHIVSLECVRRPPLSSRSRSSFGSSTLRRSGIHYASFPGLHVVMQLLQAAGARDLSVDHNCQPQFQGVRRTQRL